MSRLFGYNQKEKMSLSLKLFCDEITTGKWIYIGILIVPKTLEQNLLRDLSNKRCNNPAGNKIWGQCNSPCEYHNKNDTEVHFREIEKSKDKYFVAQRWLDYLLRDKKNIYFYILGIDLNKLDKSRFGAKSQQDNIYNRFFRTAILKSVKSYFNKYDQITIEKVYHDNSTSLKSHFYFTWHSIFKVEDKDDKISFKTNKIIFIDSDHRKSSNQYSNFIQFIDLLLGCIYNCLEYTSKNKDKEKLSMKCLPLIQRLIENPNNRRSRFNYVGRQKIDFFPKHDLKNLNDISLEYQYKRMTAFYTKRLLKIKNKNQTVLPFL